jgi:hypothetical protein
MTHARASSISTAITYKLDNSFLNRIALSPQGLPTETSLEYLSGNRLDTSSKGLGRCVMRSFGFYRPGPRRFDKGRTAEGNGG